MGTVGTGATGGTGGTDGPDAAAHDVRALLDAVDGALPFTTVTSAAGPATTWVADVVRAAPQDPLRGWREALRDQMARRHATAVPAHVPAAFVLQWWCEVVATPLAVAGGLGGPLLEAPAEVLAEALGFELAPGLHPYRVVVVPERVQVHADPDPDPVRRRQRARSGYDRLVRDVVTAFAPEVRMGSRQRWGVVDDVWATAWRAGEAAAGRRLGPVPRRVSCCFVYALPGMRECAACPRGAIAGPRGVPRDVPRAVPGDVPRDVPPLPHGGAAPN